MTTNPPPAAAATESVGAEWVGVILAGGKSSRMGQDKAALQLGGESLLQRAQKTLQATGCGLVLLSGQPRPDWRGSNIPDLAPGTGPVGGIISVLQAVATQSATVVFIPVDAPLLSPDLLQMLLTQAQKDDGCTIEGTPLPLGLRTTPAVMQQCAATLRALQAGESRSVKQFLLPLQLARIQQTDAIRPCLSNVNTPAEWEGLRCEFENRP